MLPTDNNNYRETDLGIEPVSVALLALSALVGLTGLNILWRKVIRVRGLIGETVILITRSGRTFQGNLDKVNWSNTQYTVDGHTVRSDSVSLLASKVKVDSGKTLEIAREQYMVAAITLEELGKVIQATKEKTAKRRDAEKERKAQRKGLPPAPLSNRGRQGEEAKTFKQAKEAWVEFQLAHKEHGRKDEAVAAAKALDAYKNAPQGANDKARKDLAREMEQANASYSATDYGPKLMELNDRWLELQRQVVSSDNEAEEVKAAEKQKKQEEKEAPKKLEEAAAGAAS